MQTEARENGRRKYADNGNCRYYTELKTKCFADERKKAKKKTKKRGDND